MTARRKDPDVSPPSRLSRRRRAIAEVANVASMAPTAYVESPVHTVLSQAHRIIETELAFIERAQRGPNPAAMSPADAKKFAALVAAFERTVTISREADETQMAALSDADIEAQLVAELERMRSKKKVGL